jgi:hypothetical protein
VLQVNAESSLYILPFLDKDKEKDKKKDKDKDKGEDKDADKGEDADKDKDKDKGQDKDHDKDKDKGEDKKKDKDKDPSNGEKVAVTDEDGASDEERTVFHDAIDDTQSDGKIQALGGSKGRKNGAEIEDPGKSAEMGMARSISEKRAGGDDGGRSVRKNGGGDGAWESQDAEARKSPRSEQTRVESLPTNAGERKKTQGVLAGVGPLLGPDDRGRPQSEQTGSAAPTTDAVLLEEVAALRSEVRNLTLLLQQHLGLPATQPP